MKVLVISGHPDIKNSLANKAIFKHLESVENITINNLANKYPDYKIDIEKAKEYSEKLIKKIEDLRNKVE